MPTRGEIWWCDLAPTRGAEIQKTRPVVVVNRPVFDRTGMRIIVPLTSWQSRFAAQANKIEVRATPTNGLRTTSAADVLQVRAVAVERLTHQIGVIEAQHLRAVSTAIAVAVGYRP